MLDTTNPLNIVLYDNETGMPLVEVNTVPTASNEGLRNKILNLLREEERKNINEFVSKN